MTSVTCSICSARTASKQHGGSWFSECMECGYAQLVGFSSKPDYWPGDVASHSAPDFWVAAKHAYFVSALELLGDLSTGRKLLDFGGGIGYFSQLARQKGWDAYSLDVSPHASDAAASRIGPERVLHHVDQIQSASFDVVTLWCVLAHVRDPAAVIRQVQSSLAPGGLVWITTPNFRFQKPYSAVRAKLGRRIDFDAEDHVGHFTFEAIARLLRHTGFTHPQQQFVGITERCIAAGSEGRLVVSGKRRYNQFAFALARRGFPNYVSELQITARRRYIL